MESPLRKLTAVLLLCCSLVPRCGWAAVNEPSSPTDQLNALLKEYQTAQQEFMKLYQQAKTDEERQKLMPKYPQPASYTGRFFGLAEKHPRDPVAIEALVWIVQNARIGPDFSKALDVLLRDHIESARLADVASVLAYSDPGRAPQSLRQLIEKSPHRDVRGQATFALGLNLMNTGNSAKAEELFEKVVTDFGDLKSYRGTLADRAQAQLFEIRELGIGKLAPDISGEDVDGNKFKLSDYRGKVVVIDFWGDW